MIYKIHHYGKVDELNWTCISEVGSEINGHTLTWNDYKTIENQYVNLLNDVLDYCRITQVKVESAGYWERENDFYPHDNFKSFDISKLVKVGQFVNKNDFLYLFRWELRGVCCTYVTFDQGFIGLGDDYYMYIKTDKDLSELINASGLYYWIIEKNPLRDES